MDLRDQFAMHAPEAQSHALAGPAPRPPIGDAPEDMAQYQRDYALWVVRSEATWAYAYADAMMEARKAKVEPGCQHKWGDWKVNLVTDNMEWMCIKCGTVEARKRDVYGAI